VFKLYGKGVSRTEIIIAFTCTCFMSSLLHARTDINQNVNAKYVNLLSIRNRSFLFDLQFLCWDRRLTFSVHARDAFYGIEISKLMLKYIKCDSSRTIANLLIMNPY